MPVLTIRPVRNRRLECGHMTEILAFFDVFSHFCPVWVGHGRDRCEECGEPAEYCSQRVLDALRSGVVTPERGPNPETS